MSEFSITTLAHSTVLYLHSDRELYQLDPEYQRESDIWPLDKRQLLIDSIISGFDIPKIYFHKFSKKKKIGSKTYTHAIVDGKQRLSSIWGFIDGDFSLSAGAEYLPDPSQMIAGLTYSELAKKYPKIKAKFDSFPLSIVVIETDDLDLIEDMFSRLNEAVPLSAAEKRNAFGGPIPKVIRSLAAHTFFAQKLPFPNKRYRHFDLIAKFLVTEDKDKVVDTKKVYLDEFVRAWKGKPLASASTLRDDTKSVLNAMSRIFTKSDPLLRSVGMVVLYYHLIRIAKSEGWLGEVTRNKLVKFEDTRAENKKIAERNISAAKYDLLEFGRFVQTPNDAYAISVRLNILLRNVFNAELSEDYEA